MARDLHINMCSGRQMADEQEKTMKKVYETDAEEKARARNRKNARAVRIKKTEGQKWL